MSIFKGGGKQQLFTHGNNGQIAAGATAYLNPHNFGLVGAVSQIITRLDCNFSEFQINLSSAQPASGSLVFDLLINAAAVGYTLVIPAGSPAGSYVIEAIYTIPKASSFGYRLINNAAGLSANIIACVGLLLYP